MLPFCLKGDAPAGICSGHLADWTRVTGSRGPYT